MPAQNSGPQNSVFKYCCTALSAAVPSEQILYKREESHVYDSTTIHPANQPTSQPDDVLQDLVKLVVVDGVVGLVGQDGSRYLS